MFTPLRTKRLLLRPTRPDDAASLHARRNHPEVARYQDWMTPFPLERAERLVNEIFAMDGPTPDEWWMATVEETDTGDTIADLAVHLTWEGRTAEIGYTFARDSWGKGYAVEAVDALIDWLFEDPKLTRISATLHPDNRASAMVLERTGFLHEGHTRLSFWNGDDNSDDWIYGLIRSDRGVWKNRARTTPDEVHLIPVTSDNERDVFRLRTHKTQEDFVAPMGHSFTDALFPEIVDGAPVVPWLRAVVADDEMVGFVMLALTTEHHPEPYLWRLLVDRLHQRRGIGHIVLDLIAAECIAMGDRALLTSWEEGRGSPARFYLSHGFEATGRIVDEETEGRKILV